MSAHSFEQSEPGTAAEWFAARRGPPNENLERRFRAWLESSAQNFEAYALCELTWELTATAATGLEIASPRTPWYRHRTVGAIAASVLIAALGISGFVWLSPPRPSVASTRPGEQKLLELPDGSRITLNTRSTVEVRLGRNTRDIRLLAGEAFFDVAHESRPFIVETSLGTVRAVGTRFDVLMDEQRVVVSMEEGRVLVKGSVRDGVEVAAVAGVRATLLPGRDRAVLGSADLESIQNWRSKRIEFDRVPLATALKEFSRYTPIPIRAQTPQIGALSISALLKTGDVDALAATLKGAFGLRLVRGTDEIVVTAADP